MKFEEHMKYWIEDLKSLKQRVSNSDSHFSSVSFFLLKIINDSYIDNEVTSPKKRCIEKIQSYRHELIMLMGECRMLARMINDELPDDFQVEIPPFSIPPAPSYWYWDQNTCDGVERLSSLLSKLGRLSDQIGENINSLLRTCNKVCSHQNNNSK